MDIAGLAPLAVGDGGVALPLAVTVLLAGFRHGFDIDHVAAITDIASATPGRRTSVFLATMYAVGHMIVVFALGAVAVLAGDSLPASWDAVASRLIGLSLILLGLYVVYSVVRYRRDFRMRGRWMTVIAASRRGLLWLRPARLVVVEHEHEHPAGGHHDHGHEHHGSPPDAAGHSVATVKATHAHAHSHVVPMPPDPFTEYTPKTSFVIGMIHGVGAETPTQILLLTTAAGVAGALGGVALVALFVGGLLLGNTLLAVVAAAGMSAGRRLPVLYMGLAVTTALVSIAVGWTYVFAPA